MGLISLHIFWYINFNCVFLVQFIEKSNKQSEWEALKASVRKQFKAKEPVFYCGLPQSKKWTLPSLSYGESEEVSSFSSAVSIEHSKALGRHLVANRDIETGICLLR